MNISPLISIITVTKNCVSTIERTLESIATIKEPDIQYIIVDGKSSDGTLAIIENYEHLVDRLISEEDSGIYNAMNKGVVLAQGKYTLFLNGDDYILPDGFYKAKIILEKQTPEILSCQSEAFAENGVKDSTLFPSLWRLYFFNSIPHLSTFVSTDLQKKYKFRENFKIAADYDLFLRMFLKGHHFVLSKLVTSVHHRGGFSNNSLQANVEIKQIKKDNLGPFSYSIVRWIELLNRLRKVFLVRIGFK